MQNWHLQAVKTTGPNEIPQTTRELEPTGIQNCQDFHGNPLYGIEISYGMIRGAFHLFEKPVISVEN